MDDLLIFGGLIMFLVGVVMLVKAFVKKTKKKQCAKNATEFLFPVQKFARTAQINLEY